MSIPKMKHMLRTLSKCCWNKELIWMVAVLAFREDCVPLKARVSDILGLHGVGLKGAMIAKKKSSTQNTLCDSAADNGIYVC